MVNFFANRLKEEPSLNIWRKNKRPDHAILLLGDSIQCKITVRTIAAELLGLEKNPDWILSPRPHADFFMVEGNGEIISIDTVRAIKEESSKKVCEALRKVCLIEDASRFTFQAQNALLKLLEEPPPDMIFLLCAENKNRLLKTLISRLVVINLKPLMQRECGQILIQNYNIPESEADELSVFFDASLSRCVHCLKDSKSYSLFKLSRDFVNQISGNDLYHSAVTLSEISIREEFLEFLENVKFGLMVGVKKGKPVDKIECFIKIVDETAEMLRQNSNLGLTVSCFLAMFC